MPGFGSPILSWGGVGVALALVLLLVALAALVSFVALSLPRQDED